MIKRDYYLGSGSVHLRRFYERPVKELVKWVRLFARIMASRLLGPIYRVNQLKKLARQRRFARASHPVMSAHYAGDGPYFELQIGNETRQSAVIPAKETFSFALKVESDQDFLFGIAPCIDEFKANSITTWGARVRISVAGESELKSFDLSMPYNGRSDCYAYFPGDGWIDLKLSLDDWVGKECTVEIAPLIEGCDEDANLSLACPQIVQRRKPSSAKNVVLLSIESLTDLNYLRRKYGDLNLPNIEKFLSSAVSYPHVYSPGDNTLSFAASLLTGLLPSQHGIGNYAIPADSYNNKRLNDNLVSLGQFFKQQGYLTLFGGTQVRYSSRVGWARGFDQYFHMFEKWSPNVPQFNWLAKTLTEYGAYDKFIYAHIDFLHDPLISFNERDKGRLHNVDILSKSGDGMTAAIYKEQLCQFDYAFGNFLKSLELEGILDNTAIVMTGDHGCGINWVKHCEYSLYEERLRVPLFAKYPDWSAGKQEPNGITNSISEIQRILYAMCGKPMPSYLTDLPQYDEAFQGFAFSETIMNPKRQYEKHALAMIHSPYKYVCWNEIDWDAQSLREHTDEKIFLWNQQAHDFDDSKDQSSQTPEALRKYRDVARKVVDKNLEFLSSYSPESY